MAKSKSGRSSVRQRWVLVVPTEEKLRRLRSRLVPFKPIDLREIVREAERSPGLTPEKVRMERIARQIRQVLQVLGFPDVKSTDWVQAFYALGEVFLGLGHVRYTPPRRGRGAMKWDDEAEMTFLSMVIKLKQNGKSERQAVHEIAADPKMWRLHYKSQIQSFYGGEIEQAKREVALHRKLQRIKQKGGLEAAFGPKALLTPLYDKYLELELGKLAGYRPGDKRNG